MSKRLDNYILIIEDSDIDYEIALRSLGKVGVTVPLKRVENGDQALKLLLEKTQADHPVLILLDLNLPGTDGRDVLMQLKQDEHIRAIPLIILSTSNNHNDVKFCYCAGANGYIKKPTKPDDYVEMADALKKFWFDWSILPSEEC